MEHLRGCVREQRQSVADPEGAVPPTEERQPGDDKKAERWNGLSTSLEGASRTVHLQRDYRRQPEQRHRGAVSGEGSETAGRLL